MKKNIIAIRICSPQKNFLGNSLSSIYTNPMLQAFFRKMKALNIDYALFSRKNGIQLEGNCQAYHSIEEISDQALIQLLQTQIHQFENTLFLYWNHRPLTHTKYVNMMRLVGFEVIELRTLSEFQSYGDLYMNFGIQTKLEMKSL